MFIAFIRYAFTTAFALYVVWTIMLSQAIARDISKEEYPVEVFTVTRSKYAQMVYLKYKEYIWQMMATHCLGNFQIGLIQALMLPGIFVGTRVGSFFVKVTETEHVG